MHSVTIKIIGFVVSAFIITMVISQIVSYVTEEKQETVEATYISVSDSIDFKGIYVRNETVINQQANGIIKYIYPDGSKIAKNSVIAESYNSKQTILAEQKIESIQSELKGLERAVNPGIQMTAQPEFLSSRIDELNLNLQDYISDKDYVKVESTKAEIQVMMNILSLITNSQSKDDINERIADLKSQLISLNSSISSPAEVISSEKDGYFVSYIDGAEDKLNFEKLKDMSYDELELLINQDYYKNNNIIGKVLENYSWEMAGVIQLDNKFIQGTDVNLKLNESSTVVPVKLESLTPVDNTDNSIIVVSCDELSSDMVQNRTENVSLIFNNYSGIKVPRKAIRFKDGVKGVYVLVGQNIKFKKLDVLYEGNDFVISKNTSDTSFVVLYDQILLGEVNYVETSNTSGKQSEEGNSDKTESTDGTTAETVPAD